MADSLKDILLGMYFVYITVMSFYSFSQIEEFVEIFIVIWVWGILTALGIQVRGY
mgnify:CR=1 FL=1|tara:strand:+ start:1888 stop:2052 length:165 start_codon:yes stop_codon:yes gene_type:complete